jgi:hypothetical protein
MIGVLKVSFREDTILHSHHRENLKSHEVLEKSEIRMSCPVHSFFLTDCEILRIILYTVASYKYIIGYNAVGYVC